MPLVFESVCVHDISLGMGCPKCDAFYYNVLGNDNLYNGKPNYPVPAIRYRLAWNKRMTTFGLWKRGRGYWLRVLKIV